MERASRLRRTAGAAGLDPLEGKDVDALVLQAAVSKKLRIPSLPPSQASLALLASFVWARACGPNRSRTHTAKAKSVAP